MRITLLGKRWTLVRKRMPQTSESVGYCDHPETPAKQIAIDQSLTGIEELEVTLHELLHACCWWLDEEYVELIAFDIAVVLDKLGYRKHGSASCKS